MGETILVAGLLTAAALAASLLAGRLRVPGLLLFLGVGMLVGSDGLGWVAFDDYELARDIGIVALAVIIFEGGLSSRAAELRPVLWSGLSLAVLATIITALVTGLAAAWLFDLSLLEGLLLGSIVASTDAGAVFALLRGSPLRPRLARLLEGEAGSNDPVAILLVLGFIAWLADPGYGVADMVLLFVHQVSIGIAAGLGLGGLAVFLLRRVDLATPGLYPVASLTVCALAFGSADAVGGSGFLAVFLAGLVLGSNDLPAKRTMAAFHDGLAWLAQLALFLTLGLLVFPSQLASIAVEGLVLAAVLVLVARPVASIRATAFGRFSLAERILLGWVGLRGAVPVTLATFPLIAGVPDSLEFFNIVFFAVVVSLLVQGPTIEPLARRLGLTTTEASGTAPLVEIASIRRLGADVIEYAIAAGDAIDGAAVRDLGLPREAVVRGDKAIPPRGSTRLHAGDRLHVLVRLEESPIVDRLAVRWRTGPIGPPPRPARPILARTPLFTVRPAGQGGFTGSPAHPATVLGHPGCNRSSAASQRTSRSAWARRGMGCAPHSADARRPRGFPIDDSRDRHLRRRAHAHRLRARRPHQGRAARRGARAADADHRAGGGDRGGRLQHARPAGGDDDRRPPAPVHRAIGYVAIRAGHLSGGRSFALVIALAGATAVLAAFLDNLTTILLVVPVTSLLADELEVDPIPLILIEIMACNIGGTATLIGDPPNIMIAGATGSPQRTGGVLPGLERVERGVGAAHPARRGQDGLGVAVVGQRGEHAARAERGPTACGGAGRGWAAMLPMMRPASHRRHGDAGPSTPGGGSACIHAQAASLVAGSSPRWSREWLRP